MKAELQSSDQLGGATFRRAADKVAEYIKVGRFDRARYLMACMENFACASKAYDEVRNDTVTCTKEFAAGFEYLMMAADSQLRRHIERADAKGVDEDACGN